MAISTINFSLLLRFLPSAYLLSICLLCVSIKSYAVEETQATETQHHLHHTHTVQLSSLLPSSDCNPSSKASERKSSLKVVHKHGPCFQLDGEEAKSPSHEEILRLDESRVKAIQSRLSKNSVRGDIKETDATTLPAKDGTLLGSANYIVTVGLGSPKKDLSLVFDTGSDLTWTQCEPCVGFCYEQKETKFDPRISKTYGNVSCSSALCSSLASATGFKPICSSSTCVYGIKYGDSSFSQGFLGKETLTLTSSDVFPDFYFGCGQDNEGLFFGAAGLLGLGRDQLSLVSQTAQKYKKFFSYCLPSTASSTGHLTFGNDDALSKSVKFTPLATITRRKSLYGLDITQISVGGQKLSIPSSAFSTAGTIIDSGTVITRLPPAAYSALSTSFRQLMAKYPTAPALAILDTCYDFSKYTSVTLPTISFFFSGGVEVSLDKSGIMYASSLSQACLAFAGNNAASNVAIFGNVQQKTLEVVYDGLGGRVGFGSGGCN